MPPHEPVPPDRAALDSGDLEVLSRSVRAILDAGGLGDVHIVASGDLDEHASHMVAAEVPIDAFGGGTQMGTSTDARWLGAVYKLAEDVDGPKAKRSTGKATLPGRKQVWRARGPDERFHHDVITLSDESLADAEPVLEWVMADGVRVLASPNPAQIRERGAASLAALP